MAKVKDPFGAREARGSVGGITASRNTMGQYLRCKASPVQPRTAAQQERRYDFQKLVREFQSLTAAGIQEWIDFASAWPVLDKFGDSISVTALNWYITLNARLMAAGVASQTAPPLNPNADYTPSLSVAQDVAGGGDIELTFSPAPSTTQRIWLFKTQSLPQSSQFAKKSLRLFGKYSSADSSPVTVVDYADLSPGDSLVQFKVFAVDTHGRSTPQQRFTVYPVSVP